MRVLVTGASGFIGTALVEALAASGCIVDASDRYCLPVTEQECWTRLAHLPSGDADAIVHLAADTRGDWHTNVLGTTLGVSVVPSRNRFVFASSIAAPAARDQYEAEKLLAEQIVQARRDIGAVILRLGNVYGPGHQSRRCVLNQVLRQAALGEPIQLYGDAGGARDYVYLDDVARAFVLAVSPDVSPGIYDVGTGTASSLVAAAEEACRQAGHPGPTMQEPLGYGHAPLADERRWLPGWRPTVGLADGIARTLAWLREHEGAAAPEREEVAA